MNIKIKNPMKYLLTFIVGCLLISSLIGFSSLQSAPDNRNNQGQWVGSWYASQMPFDTNFFTYTFPQKLFNKQTIRMVIHPHQAGSSLRLKFSNLYGSEPLYLGNVDIAQYDTAGNIVRNTNKQVTFQGHKEVTIPAGKELYSDEMAYPVKESQDLAVSIYIPKQTNTSTWHFTPSQTTYVAEGNHTKDYSGAAFNTKLHSYYWLSGLDVKVGNKKTTSIIAFGDSITEGINSSLDGNHRYTDFLDERLDKDKRYKHISVLNTGISGNQILRNGSEFGIKVAGENMISRLERDVFSQSGVSDIIFLGGINDIGLGSSDANQIITGMKKIASKAHQKNLRIYIGTLIPMKNSPIYTKENEQTRQTVNKWIRSNKIFDGVIDFDKVLADPKNPDQMLPAYDSGDHLHPNDAGNEAMAKSIPLNLFLR